MAGYFKDGEDLNKDEFLLKVIAQLDLDREVAAEY